jgi:UDP-N-acetylmuramyl tripeptide synthase
MKKLIKKILFYDRWYSVLRKSTLYTFWKKFHGIFANLLYGNPSRHFFVIGVTGTNGKTTTVNLLHHMLNNTVAKTVVVSTAQIKIGDKILPNDKKMSSLDVYDLQ